MIRCVVGFMIATTLLASVPISAQSTCGNTTLSCLIPTALHTTSSAFNFFSTAFGTQIGQLPLATPASGFVFTFDKGSGVYHRASESFGPLLAQRTETIGLHKLHVAFTYQRFSFHAIDGNDLQQVPILFYFPSQQNPQVVTLTKNRVDAKIDQYAIFGTFGVTDRIDVSVAVPLERVSLGISSTGTEFSTTSTAKASFATSLAGTAAGIGDVVVSAKARVFRFENLGVAVGSELRFPSGDERNFLGSGAYGVKPYIVVSRRGRVSPHLNIGYQWNSTSALAADQNGKQSLPGFFHYALGADIGIARRWTVVTDLVGQHFFDAPQISTPREVTVPVASQPTVFSSVVLVRDSYDIRNLGIGVKANLVRNLLLSANATIKLDDGGVRAKVVPLIGISYSF